jgi:hypothetical protein
MFAKKTIAKCLLVAGLLTFSYQNTNAGCDSGSDGGCSTRNNISSCAYGDYWFWGDCGVQKKFLKDL